MSTCGGSLQPCSYDPHPVGNLLLCVGKEPSELLSERLNIVTFTRSQLYYGELEQWNFSTKSYVLLSSAAELQ